MTVANICIATPVTALTSTHPPYPHICQSSNAPLHDIRPHILCAILLTTATATTATTPTAKRSAARAPSRQKKRVRSRRRAPTRERALPPPPRGSSGRLRGDGRGRHRCVVPSSSVSIFAEFGCRMILVPIQRSVVANLPCLFIFIVHGQVLAQWPQMFRILNMFSAYSLCFLPRVLSLCLGRRG